MAIIEYDDDRTLEEQTQAILAAATATGHGAHEVVWDPATRGHMVPDDVAEAYRAGPDGIEDTEDDPTPRKRRPGRPRKQDQEQSDKAAPATTGDDQPNTEQVTE